MRIISKILNGTGLVCNYHINDGAYQINLKSTPEACIYLHVYKVKVDSEIKKSKLVVNMPPKKHSRNKALFISDSVSYLALGRHYFLVYSNLFPHVAFNGFVGYDSHFYGAGKCGSKYCNVYLRAGKILKNIHIKYTHKKVGEELVSLINYYQIKHDEKIGKETNGKRKRTKGGIKDSSTRIRRRKFHRTK